MVSEETHLSNPFSTGGGGPHFEAHIQAMFVALMLADGCAPCMPSWPIKEIKLQNKIDGYDTDDVMVVVEDSFLGRSARLFAQIRHTVRITKTDRRFGNMLRQAWSDFSDEAKFDRASDTIVLITGPLSATDTNDVPWLLGQARHTRDSEEFFRNVAQSNFSSDQKRRKLEAFRIQLTITDEDLYVFLRRFHLLTCDLGGDSGLLLSILFSYLRQFNVQRPEWLWGRLVDVVQTWNQDAGTVTRENLPADIVEAFKRPTVEVMPIEVSTTQLESGPSEDWNQHPSSSNLVIANLLGAWRESNEADARIIQQWLGSA